MTKNRQPNRLIHEKSPYLLQHAYNPVDWFPWGDEAFEKAKNEDKPIFLSIGYSTCHWCHVMARESFEDDDIAALINTFFVPIKVDREERPDIDNIYMTVCQMMTGQGGWPLTILMTPEKRPFYAATYLPKKPRQGIPGIIDILQEAAVIWEHDRQYFLNVSENVTDTIKYRAKNKPGKLQEKTLEDAYFQLCREYDGKYGGFSPAPKFPLPHGLLFLLRYWKHTGEQQALEMVVKTLDCMSAGGIFDHVGFGFHRYSTDEKWLIPHFEKMLYDNALLAYTYLEAFQATGDKHYAQVAKQIFTYIKSSMTSPEGGFYSAEDADSEGVEGKFYAWTPEEIKDILGTFEGELFCKVYDITAEGNFEDKSIPNLIGTSVEKIAEQQGFTYEQLKEKLEGFRQKLFGEREKRVHPHKDDKILTAWNGLMIAALAKGARVLDDEQLTESASKAVDFIYNNLIRDDGRLMARYRDNHPAFLAYLDDYAFFIWGLLELYETTFDINYLEKARELCNEMIRLFWDEEQGGFFFYGSDSEELLIRPKEIYDSALPSGNSVAAYTLIKLSRLLGKTELDDKVEELFSISAQKVSVFPAAHTFLLLALLDFYFPGREVVITGDPKNEDTVKMISKLRSKYLTNTNVILNPTGEAGDKLRTMIPFLKGMNVINDKATLYVCKNFSCQSPITDINELDKLLE